MALIINKRNTYSALFVFFVIFLLLSFTTLHPFHVSSSEIELNNKEQRIEISSKIFTDDFEMILSRLYKTKVDFSNVALKSKMNELVTRYITTHLSVRTNGRLLPLKFYGWEEDHEAIYVYTTAEAGNFDSKSITVENTILYDLFNDQMNIIHFIVNATRKSNKLNYPDRKLQFTF